MQKLNDFQASMDLATIENPWNHLVEWSADALTDEGQELVASLIMEPYGDLVDGMSSCMADEHGHSFVIDGAMTIREIRTLLENCFGWALDKDWGSKEYCARAWYVSEEKLEPRLGERFDEPIEDYEQPLAPARDAVLAYHAMAKWDENTPIADFLLKHGEHRHTIRRAQLSQIAPYGEIHDNTIAADMMPIDMLRAKLSFFGATHFDPRSDRWVRICMYAGAPYPEELSMDNSDYWVYPAVEA